MTGERDDPYRNFRFRVEIDGIDAAGFADATIPDSTTDVTDYREGTDQPFQRKLSGLTKYGNITLKKGLTDSMELYNWKKLVEDSGAITARKSISLILIDEEGNDKAQWDINEAWPTKYDSSDFSAKANEVVIETFEIVHEGVKRVK
ncbi:MAG: phage tail protein [ANME-2 cluster archaeon]|nr:phage tail protein [ANME-2 cluster archaeon]MBC2700857.1 phage tail protein [ANME-2 cluster archaeon]MBC2709322.1 phage tail protein [ANME-2 cluster archaeon]MBC2746851.1 phage tail protein [ANME-2 cluster archaeon]